MSGPHDIRTQIRDFLVSRRARVTPGDLGIPSHDTRRRVKGLRREEVAMLAGISVEYYTRLERGDASGASPSVIASVARVLRLNDIEREHLQRLMVAAAEPGGRPMQKQRSSQTVRPELQRLLDALVDVPAYLVNKRLDIVGVNRMGRALYSPMYDSQPEPVNTARFFFLDETASRAFWDDWEGVAASGVSILRAELGARPKDEDLIDLIEELQVSDEFRRRWATHDVYRHSTGVKVMTHPLVGHLELPFENLILPADPDLSLMTYNAEPGTASYDALKLLGSWAEDIASR